MKGLTLMYTPSLAKNIQLHNKTGSASYRTSRAILVQKLSERILVYFVTYRLQMNMIYFMSIM